jgi:multidrug efflux system outer membrane protein
MAGARHSTGSWRIGGLVLGVNLLTACKLGPNYHHPQLDVPDHWSADAQAAFEANAHSRAASDATPGDAWWRVFGDAALDQLIESAARQNLDVAQAELRIAESRAQRDIAAAPLFPAINGTGFAARTRLSDNGIGTAFSGGSSNAAGGSMSSGMPSWLNFFQAGFDATWELDLFGRVRRNVEAADAQVRSAEAARVDALVSLSAEIARVYFNLLGYQRQLNIALEEIKTQERRQQLVTSRNRSGLAPDSDVAAQRTQLSADRAAIPALEQGVAQSKNRLALLLALPPGALAATGQANLPPLPPEVPVGLPGDLLRRRPDIRERESELAAATARIGVAEAALFPRVTLGAGAGFQSTASSTLFDWASRFFAGGGEVSLPIFSGGQLTGQVRIANLQQQEALLSYRQAVLNAFHEVDDALIAYAADQRRASAVQEQLEGAHRSRDLAAARYHDGLSAYIEVLDADRQAHQAEQDLAQAEVAAAADLIALFKALGGGWNGLKS